LNAPPEDQPDPARVLRRVALLLETAAAPGYRVQAFRRAAAVIDPLSHQQLAALVSSGRLRRLPGVGETTAGIIAEAMAGDVPAYLRRLEAEAGSVPSVATEARPILRALQGDCHTHSDWSDGGATIPEMVEAAIDLGRSYIVLTDHSPRLTVARGLTAERLREQLKLLTEINAGLAPFRILTGIEVDILEDGSLDQEESLLAELDLVVGSVHSQLRMQSDLMTRRMLTAIANPHLDILGHCTGRLISARNRPESTFDAAAVFAAAARYNKAIEINSRPERLDPPDPLLTLAVEAGCRFAIDSDAHAPGQLTWLRHGAEMAARCNVDQNSIVNTLPAPDLLAWTASHAKVQPTSHVAGSFD
jgi:putative hydrolase